MNISFDKNSLIIDGKRVFIRSGAFHYFRSPGAELALDRFRKLKAAGYNAVDIYFNWNYHSKSQGEYDFTEIKDVEKVLQCAKDTGLFVIARPGPFINAEVNAGGLPFWMLKKNGVIPRNRIGTEYNYSKEYMECIDEWYNNIIPIITKFDNIIAFQIENEYATDEMDETYLKELYEKARNLGIKCPIFHNDAYSAGLWADIVDIYATDIYPYINPNQNWKQDHFCFDTIDNIEDIVRSFKDNAPIFIAEMQCGWFDKWDGIGYKKMRAALGEEHVNIMTKTAISQGVTMFNHYMAVGGTSWDDLACDEVYTSYEFCAAIDEFGSIQPNFYKCKEINYFLNSFGLENTCERENLDLGENIYSVRRKDNDNNCSWVFARNMNENSVSLSTEKNQQIFLKPYDMKICPENLELFACKIKFSDVEVFARIKNDTDEVLFMIAAENSNLVLDIDGNEVIHSGDKNNYDHIKYEKNGKSTQILFLKKELADRTWVLEDKAIFNADFVYPNGRIALSKTTEVAYFDLKNGFSKKYFKVKETPVKIELKDFEVSFTAPEIDTEYNFSKNNGWKKISDDTDCLSIGLYDEFIWYKTILPDTIKEITLSARHLFSLYINGKEVLNRNSYKYEKLKQVDETISLELNRDILSKEKNELTILVQNIGFDKGFSGDTNHPRGLISFETNPKTTVDFWVNEKFSFERNDFTQSENAYLTKLSTEFGHEFKENVLNAKYLSLKDFPYARATIFLNGIKIGRHLKNTENKALQDDYYLPEPFLKEKNILEIIIWERASHIKSPWEFQNELKSGIIHLGDKSLHQLF